MGVGVCNRAIHRCSVCLRCEVVHLGLDSSPAMVRWVMGCSEVKSVGLGWLVGAGV